MLIITLIKDPECFKILGLFFILVSGLFWIKNRKKAEKIDKIPIPLPGIEEISANSSDETFEDFEDSGFSGSDLSESAKIRWQELISEGEFLAQKRLKTSPTKEWKRKQLLLIGKNDCKYGFRFDYHFGYVAISSSIWTMVWVNFVSILFDFRSI